MASQALPEMIEKYFRELEEHILSRIHDGKVGDSCFAAVMFMFAAIDSLGRLMAPRESAGYVRKRFDYILAQYFPAEYMENEEALWDLRNDLMHNALNVGTFLAATQDMYEHLEAVHSTDYLFLNTGQFHIDLCLAVEKVKEELAQDQGKANDRSRRLQEASIPSWDVDKTNTTPYAAVWFRQI